MDSNKKIKLVVANWKMAPRTLLEAKKTFTTYKKFMLRRGYAGQAKNSDKGVTVVFCPPFQYIRDLKKDYKGNKIFFGAQDIFYEKEGAYTGEISGDMIKDLGARFVIVGHSERRALGETNEIISKKLKTSLEFGFHTILCIGEKERDFEGNYLKELSQQISGSLSNISPSLVKNLIIAYEPVWAVGEGHTAMDFKEMHFISLFIKKQLMKIFNKKNVKEISIIYGGSVDCENAGSFIKEGEIDGLLVGRASLNPYEFSKIVSNVSKTF